MHCHCVGLLNLADASEFYVIAEPAAQFSSSGVCAKVTARETRQDEKTPQLHLPG
jgi:hypothetical protein